MFFLWLFCCFMALIGIEIFSFISNWKQLLSMLLSLELIVLMIYFFYMVM